MDTFNIGYLIRGTIRNVDKYIDKQLTNMDISKGQFAYFIIISQNEGINQQQLASLMNVGKASVTKAIKILHEQGLIERKINYSDQRNFNLYISDKGLQHIGMFNDLSAKVNQVMFKNFSENDKDTLIALLKKLNKNSLALDLITNNS